jgi:hypothetical protein
MTISKSNDLPPYRHSIKLFELLFEIFSTKVSVFDLGVCSSSVSGICTPTATNTASLAGSEDLTPILLVEQLVAINFHFNINGNI